jgi:hypothetical protein
MERLINGAWHVQRGTGRNTFSGETFFVTARFNVGESPDVGFGTGGFVRTQLSDLGESAVTAVAIAPDGKIVVVGEARVSGGVDEQELAAARYNTDGSLDNTFDGNGVLSRDLSPAGRQDRRRRQHPRH